MIQGRANPTYNDESVVGCLGGSELTFNPALTLVLLAYGTDHLWTAEMDHQQVDIHQLTIEGVTAKYQGCRA